MPAPDFHALTRDAHEPSQGETGRALVAIWGEVLHQPWVGRHDDFFELGGHSLAAMQVASLARKRLGMTLALRTLLTQRSLAALAQAVSDDGIGGIGGIGGAPTSGWSPLVPIKPSGGGPPLFLVHPSTGQVTAYSDLAGRLPADQPVYGLEAVGLVGERPAIDEVAAMASSYVDAIRIVQDMGPNLLGGWSAGGIIALEMARQLVQRGERIAFLGLIDSAPPARPKAHPTCRRN